VEEACSSIEKIMFTTRFNLRRRLLVPSFFLFLVLFIKPAAAASYCSDSEKVDTDVWTNSLASTSDPNIFQKLKNDLSKCSAGDVISIPSQLDWMIGEFCDFNKTIIAEPNTLSDPYSGHTFCVMVSERSDD
jgi:hypothetical protein